MEKGRNWLKPADQLDLWLESLGHYRKHTARDSSCLFRAVSEQVFLTQVYHTDVRRHLLDYMLRHKAYFQSKLTEVGSEEDIVAHVGRLRNQREWAGIIELFAVARYFRTEVYVRIGQEGEEEISSGYRYPRRLMLCLSQERHYDSLYTKSYINNSAFCQAVLYEILYKKVFRMEEVDYAVSKMLHDKADKAPRDFLALYSPSLEDERLELRDRCFNAKELLDLGITPFPYKVAKALDTEIYRNVEFDIWNDYRKGLRYGLCSWNCKEIQIGVKCQINTPEGEVYEGHVQDMQPNRGPVLVYILQLGEKITVPYEWLEVIIPPSPPLPSPIKTSDRPLSDLFGKLKEAASRKSCFIPAVKEQPQVPSSSCDGYADTGVSSTYQGPYPYQEGSRAPAREEISYPYTAKPGDETRYYVEPQTEEKTLPNPRPEQTEFPNTDVNTLRFFYNLGVEHMRMNCMMRPCYLGISPVCVPMDSAPPPEPVIAGAVREEVIMEPDESIQHQMNAPRQIPVDKRNSQVYEGAPLIQQYEVSSTTGGVTPLTPIQPAPPPTPFYYQPVEVEGVPQYCPPPAALYVQADYGPAVYDYAAPIPAYPQIPQFQYVPAEQPVYFVPHIPPTHP